MKKNYYLNIFPNSVKRLKKFKFGILNFGVSVLSFLLYNLFVVVCVNFLKTIFCWLH